MEKPKKWFKELYEILPYQEIFSNEEIKITRKVQITRKDISIQDEPIIDYNLDLFVFDSKSNRAIARFIFFTVRVNDPHQKFMLDLVNLQKFCNLLKDKIDKENINSIKEMLKEDMIYMLRYAEVEEKAIEKLLENFEKSYNNYSGLN